MDLGDCYRLINYEKGKDMKQIQGDLIKLAEEGYFDVIIHGCNCFCTMGAGIAKSVRAVFPQAYQADLQTIKGDKDKLGTFSHADVMTEHGKLTIINAYTQYDWERSKNKQLADYEAIRAVFKAVKENYTGKRIGYPAIGAGLAHGDWAVISAIIEEELAGEDHTFVQFVG